MNLSDEQIISYVKSKTEKGNIDNISRTNYYADFYDRNPEIKWAFLASMVSRNAGWCMTDLQNQSIKQIIPLKMQKDLFLTYEKANFLIFQDAYPQLLLYELSKLYKKPLFSILTYFDVSTFMHYAWEHFWKYNNETILVYSLIINEQNIIQKPVVENEYFKKNVFRTIPYKFQDMFHFSTVIFPTLEGKLYGFSVNHFQKVNQRIELGKKLAWLLFHPKYYDEILEFSHQIPHTGSRGDYEVFLNKKRSTPLLRTVYPIISHTERESKKDWFQGQSTKKCFFLPQINKTYEVTKWFQKKQKQLQILSLMEEYVMENVLGKY